MPFALFPHCRLPVKEPATALLREFRAVDLAAKFEHPAAQLRHAHFRGLKIHVEQRARLPRGGCKQPPLVELYLVP